MINAISDAIRYANDDSHNGAGFQLLIRYAGCPRAVRADVYGTHTDYRLATPDGQPLFVNPANVASVRIAFV